MEVSTFAIVELRSCRAQVYALHTPEGKGRGLDTAVGHQTRGRVSCCRCSMNCVLVRSTFEVPERLHSKEQSDESFQHVV